MPFNSNTYHANRCRRAAKAGLTKARDIKARAARGEAYDWEIAGIASIVRVARLDMKLARSYDRLRELERHR